MSKHALDVANRMAYEGLAFYRRCMGRVSSVESMEKEVFVFNWNEVASRRPVHNLLIVQTEKDTRLAQRYGFEDVVAITESLRNPPRRRLISLLINQLIVGGLRSRIFVLTRNTTKAQRFGQEAVLLFSQWWPVRWIRDVENETFLEHIKEALPISMQEDHYPGLRFRKCT